MEEDGSNVSATGPKRTEASSFPNLPLSRPQVPLTSGGPSPHRSGHVAHLFPSTILAFSSGVESGALARVSASK